MNLILLHSDDEWIDSSTVLLSDQRFIHMRDVLHVDVGDLVKVGLVGGHIGEALITAIDEKSVRLIIHLKTSPPPRHRLDVAPQRKTGREDGRRSPPPRFWSAAACLEPRANGASRSAANSTFSSMMILQ